jgi:hypothetical protein
MQDSVKIYCKKFVPHIRVIQKQSEIEQVESMQKVGRKLPYREKNLKHRIKILRLLQHFNAATIIWPTPLRGDIQNNTI